MPIRTRRLIVATLIAVAALAASKFAYSQVRPTPVDPVVLSGNDIGFRMTANKRGTPVGQLVVRVNGEWKEVEFAYGVKPLTQ